MKPTAQQLRKFAADPMDFIESLALPSATGTVRFGDCMADFQRERFTALAPSLLALARGEQPPIGKFWLEATKGCSKDTDIGILLLWLLAFTSRPLHCQAGAADQDQADELRKSIKLVLSANPWLNARIEVQNWKVLCKPTGSEVEIVAADIAGSHGAKPHLLLLNEVHAITRWEFAQNLLDNASKQPWGIVVAATNAGRIGTEAWKLREIARTSNRWRFLQYAQPAPWLDPAEIEEARQRNTAERFARLFLGVWSHGLGDALEYSDLMAAVNPDLGPMNERGTGFGFVAGLDLGIKSDHSALVVVGKSSFAGQDHFRLASCRSWAPNPVTGKVDLGEVEQAIIDAHRVYRLQQVAYDPWQAAYMSERLSGRGIPMREVPFTGANLNLLARNLLEAFRNRAVSMFDCPRLISDLQKLSIIEKSYGYKLEATRDDSGHADTATGFVLALLAAREANITPARPWEPINFSFWGRQPVRGLA